MATPQIGQKSVPLKDWQRFLKVADWWDRVHGHNQPSTLRPDRTWPFRLQNVADEGYRRYDTLAINGNFALEPSELTHHGMWLESDIITTPARLYGVLAEPVEVDGVARAWISGPCPAFIDIINDAHRRAFLDENEGTLTSSVSGPVQIISIPTTGTGEKLCVVNLSNRASPKLYGFAPVGGIDAATKSGDTITPGSATCNVWYFDHATGDYVPMEDSGASQVTAVVFNPWPTNVSASAWITFSEDDDGLLTVDNEACEAF